MARILICEPHEDVRRLLERMVARLGHEPICATIPTPEQLTSVDALVLEAAAPVGAVSAQAAALAVPELPLICASVAAPPRDLADLDIQFAAYLVKPFTLEQLRVAIEQALYS